MTTFTRSASMGKPGYRNQGLDFEQLLDAMDALYESWPTSSSTMTATAGTPALGAGTLNVRARIIGKTVDFNIHLTAAADTTFGTAGAALLFSIPGGGTAAAHYTGTGFFLDSSTGFDYFLFWRVDPVNTTIAQWRADASPSVRLLNNAPVTMATGDQILLTGTIEIA